MLPLLSFIRPKKKICNGRYVDVDTCQCRRRNTNKICAVPIQEEATVCRVEQTHLEPRPMDGQAEGQQGKQPGQGEEWELSAEEIPQRPANEENTKVEGCLFMENLPREDQEILGYDVETSQTKSIEPTVSDEAAKISDANTSALGYEGPNPYSQYIPPGYQPPPPPNYGNQPPPVYGNQSAPVYGGQPQPHNVTNMQLGYSYDSPPQQVAGGYEPPPGYSIQEAVTSPYQNPQTHIIYVIQHQSPHQPHQSQSQRNSRATEQPMQETTTTVIYVLPKPLEDPKKRREFVRKTYSVLFLQLLFTSFVVAACTLIQPVKAWITSHQFIILIFIFLYISAIIFVCMLLPYMLTTNCFSVFVLILLTVAMSGIAGVLTTTKAQEIVLLAAATTAIAVLVMTLMACICVDFTPFIYISCVISMIFVVFGVFCILLLPYIPMIKLIYSIVGAILMCLYIIIDTQMIMGGKTHELDTNMYIFGAIELYLDIVLLFFYVLDILDS